MIYEISGRYGNITIDANNDLIAITAMYLLSQDGSCYIKQPVVNQPTYSDIDFIKKIKALYFPKEQQEYVQENKENIIKSLQSYLPGTKFTRDELIQILNSEFEDSEKDNMFKVLKETYMTDIHYDLDDRIKKVISILKYK